MAAAAALLVGGERASSIGIAAADTGARDAGKLLIVDCLLPGKVRRLGTRVTYVTARPAVKTTASDCAIRGGEYTESDRASYTTALQVWLPLANEGDPVAQTYVGEIYEKGLGVEPQHALAANWYRKAAEQGFVRAQLNLGALYEQGLGVPQDRAEAAAWYRKAAGLDTAAVPFVSAAATEEIRELRAERDRLEAERARLAAERDALRDELDSIRRRLTDTESQLDRRSREAAAARRGLDDARRQLERAVAEGRQNEILEVSRQLSDRSRELEARETEVADLRQRMRALEDEAAAVRQAMDSKLAAREAEVERYRSEAEAAKARLDTLTGNLQAAEDELDAQRRRAADADSAVAMLKSELDKEQAAANRDSGRVSTLRRRLEERERTLDAERRRAAELTTNLAALPQQASTLKAALDAKEAEERRQLAAGPSIEIIDPALPATRAPGEDLTVVTEGADARVVVGRVKAAGKLVAVLVNDLEQVAAPDGLFRVSIPLSATETPVRVVAIDDRGKKAERRFVLKRRDVPAVARSGDGAGPALLPMLAGVDFGRFHALVIGNNDYRQLPRLQSAVGDAQAVARLLEERYGYEVRLLLNADRYAILSALNTLRETLTDDDNLLVYYAGHGELDRVNNRGHWLPVDAEPTSTANWISNIQVTDILNAMSVRQVLVVADSCYSGTLTRASLAQLDAGMSDDVRANWIKLMAEKRARLVLSSGGVQPVLDTGGGQHSVFARAFLAALSENNGILEGQRLFRVLAANVANVAAAQQIEQVPQYAPIKYAGHEAGDYFFVPKIN